MKTRSYWTVCIIFTILINWVKGGETTIGSLSREAFLRLFIRTSTFVNFCGAKSPSSINKRIRAALNEYNPGLTSGWRQFLESALPEFGQKCIDEAISDPQGRVALTLKYGAKRAERILEKRVARYLAHLQEKAKKKRKRREKY